MCGRRQPLAADDVARATVGDGEGIAVEAITGLELALVVDAPGIVGNIHRLSRLACMAGVLPPSLLVDHAVTREEITDGRSRRPFDLGVPLSQDGEKLLRAPEGVPTAKLQDRLRDLEGRFVRAPFGSPRSFAQARKSFLLEADHPLVPGGSADPEAPAELGHRE